MTKADNPLHLRGGGRNEEKKHSAIGKKEKEKEGEEKDRVDRGSGGKEGKGRDDSRSTRGSG